MQPTEGGHHILACLDAEGFTITCTAGWRDSRHFAAIATRGMTTTAVRPAGFDPRIAAVDLTVGGRSTVRLAGIYGPTAQRCASPTKM